MNSWGYFQRFRTVPPVCGIPEARGATYVLTLLVGRIHRFLFSLADVHVNQATAFDKAGQARQWRSRWTIALTVLAAVSAGIDIWAQYSGARTIVYIFKPLTIVFINKTHIYFEPKTTVTRV